VEYDVTGKVKKVFSDAAKTQLKVEFQYDDRGFRLAKVNHETNKTTWYIRDASGNVTSIYTQEGIPDAANPNPLIQTEIPIYGAGKLATYYPQENGTTAYELTDHLGNVRAILRKNVATYTATMEDNGAADITNPRVQELAYFKNLFETEVVDFRMNHTPPGAVANPEMAAYLHWIDGMGGMEAAHAKGMDSHKAIGPAINLKVNPGDTLDLSVWAKYENKLNYGRSAPQSVLATALGGTFALTEGLESLPEAIQTFADGLPLLFGATAADPDTQPYAYLNYLIFDEQFNTLDAGAMRVPTTAGFDPGFELLPHQQVQFAPIAINTTGYLYAWVSNESENTKVWFDDLTITHRQSIVTQATDYGPWGDVVREQKSNTFDNYRYGYQGQFAEKDEETGWSAFELRMYDPVIGRFTTIDPEGQFSSPYIGMGNNPINGVDPNGGYLFGLFGSTREQRLEARNLQSQGLEVSCITCREIKYSWTSDWQYDPNGSPVSWADNRQTDYHYTLDRELKTSFVESVDRWSTNLATGQADFDPFTQFTLGFGGLNGAVAAGTRGLSVATTPGRALFWSGVRSSSAASFARSAGFTTLEMTTAGRFLSSTQRAVLPIFRNSLWRTASARFATGASGQVNLIIGSHFRGAASVFIRIERPILRNSFKTGRVTNFNLIR